MAGRKKGDEPNKLLSANSIRIFFSGRQVKIKVSGLFFSQNSRFKRINVVPFPSNMQVI